MATHSCTDTSHIKWTKWTVETKLQRHTPVKMDSLLHAYADKYFTQHNYWGRRHTKTHGYLYFDQKHCSEVDDMTDATLQWAVCRLGDGGTQTLTRLMSLLRNSTLTKGIQWWGTNVEAFGNVLSDTEDRMTIATDDKVGVVVSLSVKCAPSGRNP